MTINAKVLAVVLIGALGTATLAACSGGAATPAPLAEDDTATGDGGASDSSVSHDGSSTTAECSAELLSDPKNCGVCGHDCLGGACVSGACQPTVIAETSGGDWQVWNHSLFWESSRNILALDLASGQTRSLGKVDVPDLEDDESYLPVRTVRVAAVDAEGVYALASTATTPTTAARRIVLVSHTGGPQKVVVDGLVDSVALGPSDVFFRRLDSVSAEGPQSVFGILRTGGDARKIATLPDTFHGISVHGSHLYVQAKREAPEHDEIVRAPLGGGSFEAVKVLESDMLAIVGFANGGLFYRDVTPSATWQVRRHDLATGTMSVALNASARVDRLSVLVDERENLYYIDRDKGLMRAHGGDPPAVMAQFPTLEVRDLVQDDKALYFAVDGAQGGKRQLMMLAK